MRHLTSQDKIKENVDTIKAEINQDVYILNDYILTVNNDTGAEEYVDYDRLSPDGKKAFRNIGSLITI